MRHDCRRLLVAGFLAGLAPQPDFAAARLACHRCAVIVLLRPRLRRGVLLRKTKPVPARSRSRARGIVVRGLRPLRLPGPRRPWTRTRAFLD